MCFLAQGSDSVGRGERVWSGGVSLGLVGGSGLQDGLRSFEPMDMKRRSFEGLRSRVGIAWCSRTVSGAGLLSLAPSRFIEAWRSGERRGYGMSTREQMVMKLEFVLGGMWLLARSY